MKPLTAAGFAAETSVSRETLARLALYASLLRSWQQTINLVGPRTLEDIWRRHFLDSAQLVPLAPAGTRSWLDIGSGAGFPGLVLALIGAGHVHLVESDQRKAAFLRVVIHETQAPATVHAARVEALSTAAIPAGGVDAVTSRAVAEPAQVVSWGRRFAAPNAAFLLPVGRRYAAALTAARDSGKLAADLLPSRTDAAARILRLQGTGDSLPRL